jgi:hypothetical protein
LSDWRLGLRLADKNSVWLMTRIKNSW